MTVNVEKNKKMLSEARNVPIVEYLESKGIELKKRASRYVCHSPLSDETKPSFYIYPENTFFCFSSGTGGDVVTLFMLVEEVKFLDALKGLSEFSDTHQVDTTIYKKSLSREKSKKFGRFDLKSYWIDTAKVSAILRVNAYAEERGFLKGSYITSRYWAYDEDNKTFEEYYGVGFPLVDYYGNICGIKIRNIIGAYPKFQQRGASGFYVYENIVESKEPVVYIVESETSASCFARYVKDKGINCVIVSFGGINSVPNCLPFKWDYLTNRYLIIDYDGDEKKWLSRSDSFKHLRAKNIKIPTDKGNDLATLSNNGQIKDYI
jgi:hypothetical protein